MNCILQDRRGFIWFGTDDGLNRYDGNKFVIFRNEPSDTASISGNIINSLVEDKDGVIWIATADGGLTRYDYRLSPGKQFRQYKHSVSNSLSIPGNIINALLEDEREYLWLAASGNGVLRFDKRTEEFKSLDKWAGTALALCTDDKGMIWVGREGGGLLKADPRTLQIETDPRYSNMYGMRDYLVRKLFKSRSGITWGGKYQSRAGRVGPAKQKAHSILFQCSGAAGEHWQQPRV